MSITDRLESPTLRGARRLTVKPWPLFCLLIGMASAVDLQIVGRILGTEILAILLLLGLAVFSRLPVPDRHTRILMGLAGLWLAAQYASDLVNGSSGENTLRGLARAGMTIILIYIFHILLANRRHRVRMLFMGLALGSLLIPLFTTEEAILENLWKFGYGVPVSMFCAIFASVLWRRSQRAFSLVPVLGVAMLNIFLGFRSMAGIMLAIALVQFVLIIFGTRHVLPARQSLVLALLLATCIGGIIPLYGTAAERGWLGREQQERYLSQVDESGILLSGRIEWRIAPLAFMEKPWLGHGSWSEDDRYATMAWELFSGSTEPMPLEFSTLIPTHSHLLGALVEGGIFSGLFWLMVIALLGQCFVSLIRYPLLVEPSILFILFLLGWSVLFSPYGLGNRVFACFGIAAIICIQQEARQMKDRMEAAAGAKAS